MNLRRSVNVVLAVLAMMLVVAPSASAQDRYTIATGGTGGVYYRYGGALASVLSDAIEDADFTAEVTAASVDNMFLIDSGDADLAFVLSDTAFDAAQGNAPFEAPIEASSLVTLYDNYTQLVVRGESGIETLADLAGKSVSVGAPGSGTEVIALRILEAVGINPDEDITREQLGVAESAGAMRDGRLDAFFWSGGLPTAAITDLAATPNISIKLLSSEEVLGTLAETYGPFYGTGVIPAGTYPGQDADVSVITVPNVLVVRADMDEQLAYDITRAMFEHQEELAAAHPEARNLSLGRAFCSQALPYHPGAVRYLTEQGVAEGTCSIGAATPEATPAS
jgi:TRAP transporter TAXI family solute receptor